MEFEDLRAFVAVADAGSLLGAASKLGWARPTLRRRIEELEVRAGVPLVSRSSAGVSLTEAGVFLARRARALIQESNAVLASVREVGATPSGLVRVVLPVGLPPDLLLPLFARLRARHPKLALSIRFADDPLVGLLDDVDVAVYFGGGEPKGPWVKRELLRVREQLVASEDYLIAHGTPTSAEALKAHPILRWSPTAAGAGTLPLRSGGRLGIEPVLESTDIHLLRRAAATGLGIAYVPDAMLDPLLDAQPSLVPVLRDTIGRERSVRMAIPASLAEIPRIRVVVEAADELVALARAMSATRGKATRGKATRAETTSAKRPVR